MDEYESHPEVRRLRAIAILLSEQKSLLNLKIQTLVVRRRMLDIEIELKALGPIIRDQTEAT